MNSKSAVSCVENWVSHAWSQKQIRIAFEIQIFQSVASHLCTEKLIMFQNTKTRRELMSVIVPELCWKLL